MQFLKAEELLQRFGVLLDLYSELQSLSEIIVKALEDGLPPRVIRENLNGKMQVAEKIVAESRIIADMKKELSNERACGENDRQRIRECEDLLTQALHRIIELENRSRDLVMRQGMKIERR